MTPSGKHADSKPVPLAPAYHTLPHPSHHGTPHTTINWGPLEPPKTPKPWSLSCLRPAPPLRPSAALCYKEVRASGGTSVGELVSRLAFLHLVHFCSLDVRNTGSPGVGNRLPSSYVPLCLEGWEPR